jgi:hypothetical protein
MKTRSLLAVVGLAISFALPTFAQQTNTPDPQLRQRYVALVKKYDDAFNDAAAVAALFTEDGVFVTDTGPVNGRQAIEKWYTDLYQGWRPKNHMTQWAEHADVGGGPGSAACGSYECRSVTFNCPILRRSSS